MVTEEGGKKKFNVFFCPFRVTSDKYSCISCKEVIDNISRRDYVEDPGE
jgi:hypothetical protein